MAGWLAGWLGELAVLWWASGQVCKKGVQPLVFRHALDRLDLLAGAGSQGSLRSHLHEEKNLGMIGTS